MHQYLLVRKSQETGKKEARDGEEREEGLLTSLFEGFELGSEARRFGLSEVGEDRGADVVPDCKSTLAEAGKSEE